jgi:hypothetical protein
VVVVLPQARLQIMQALLAVLAVVVWRLEHRAGLEAQAIPHLHHRHRAIMAELEHQQRRLLVAVAAAQVKLEILGVMVVEVMDPFQP